MKGKRTLSLILAAIMLIGILPIENIALAAGELKIEEVRVYRGFDNPSDTGTYTISIRGENLNKADVRYRPQGSDTTVFLRPNTGSSNNFLEYTIDPQKKVRELLVDKYTFTLDETEMPKISSVKPEAVEKGKDITFKGRNFDKVTREQITVSANNEDISKVFKNSDKATLSTSEYNLDMGINHVEIERETENEDGIKILTLYNYKSLFRVYEGINIPEGKGVTIFPNRGKVGTEVTITIPDNKEKFSVFFLEDETKPFYYENMGEDPYYAQTTDKDGIIKVKVPRGLKSGRTYKVIITNNLDTYKKPKMDLKDHVTKQKTIGEFYVVDANVGPEIIRVAPNEGTSAGSYVSIIGKRFDELNIDGITGDVELKDEYKGGDKVNEKDIVEIIDQGTNNPKKLRIDYPLKDVKFNDKEVKSITRDFLVTIGDYASFEEEHIDKNVFKKNAEDTLYVKTEDLTKEDLKDPKKDVVVQITTTITISENKENEKEEYVFTEIAKLEKGYTFLPEYTDPIVEKATPDKIQVEKGGESSLKIKQDTILSIQGKNFNVFRYKGEDGEVKTNYPKVVLGGTGGTTGNDGQIFIERREDGIWYGSSQNKDKDTGEIKYEKIDGAIFEVLDKNGNIVNGIGGNEVGNSIVVTIPKGLEVSDNIVGKPLPIAVANPRRDSKDKGLYSHKNDIISFEIVPSSPVIESVNPYIVTVDGGEEITVSGRNFQDGIKVFIDGKEVPNVTRDIDKLSTRGTLKFKAPKGREGKNILQVMNPDGGCDTHEFIYVKTLNIDPKITSIAPNKGSKDTLVVIKGTNFLKPDQTISDTSGLGIYKLIGTRVSLNGMDVNDYYTEGGIIELQEYSPPDKVNKNLLSQGEDPWTKKKVLELSPYYKYANIKAGEEPYSIYVDYEGNPVIAGKDILYTFKLMGDDIKAFDQDYNYYDVNIDEVEDNKEKITLTSIDEETKEVTFNITYDLNLISVKQDEFGSKHLKIADYHDSLVLEHNGRYYLLEVDDMEKVTLSDGKNDIYDIYLDGEEVKAAKGKEIFDVNCESGQLKLSKGEVEKTFGFKTPYAVDSETKVITGHRAKVKNKNEIWVTIPKKEVPGFYDVTVRNPDTKSDTVKKGFEYLIPQSQPKINYITPSQGSVEGGYEITIYGEGFEDTSQVYIAGVKIDKKDMKISLDYKSIIVNVPKYPGDVDIDFITNKKFVPVVVVNEDGGSASRHDLFSYVIAGSRPRIDKIVPIKGSAAGGDVVEIYGYDFRFFEPYKGDIPKEGDRNFEDLDRDGKWTNMRTDRDCRKKSLDHPIFEKYCDSPVLPKIYFDSNEAKIVEFRDGYMKIIAPRHLNPGIADVYVVNNDAGTSNKVKFTYEGSNPQIMSITPNTGKKQGGENVDILGRNFKENSIRIYDDDRKIKNEKMYLVRFGEITNRDIPREKENGGRIDSGRATVRLSGGLTVEYKLKDKGPKIVLTIQEGKKTFRGEYDYSGEEVYIDVRGLKNIKDEKESYKGNELIKVNIDAGRLVVDRGYAPETEEIFKNQIETVTPSYYTIGAVPVVVENPDGVSNKVLFEYQNPDSKPQITKITKDGKGPEKADDGKSAIHSVNIRGGNIITVEGKDFREDAIIQIGDFLTINPKDIDYSLPNKMTFKMPKIDENRTGRLYKLVVINEDGGTASSDEMKPPVYFMFTKGESNPEITAIVPDRGPTTGGTKVIIQGKDFREKMEGFEGEKLKVYFGESKVDDRYLKFIDYKTIEVTAPKSEKLGQVPVRVENPDGSMTQGNVNFTYISKPTIDKVSPNKIFTNDTKTEVTITGKMFMSGAKVIVGGKIVDKKDVKKDMKVMGEGISGVDSKGNNREVAVVGGMEAASVKVENDKVLKVTFKEATDLENAHLIIINPDGGISDPYDRFQYEKPVPSKPMVLEGIPGYESTVKLIWSESSEDILNRATRYEIYGKEAKDKEYVFIGDTTEAEFLVKGLKPNTKYVFMVRALNKYGSSIDFATVTVRTLTKQEDEKLKEKEEKLKEEEKKLKEEGKEEIIGGTVVRTLGSIDLIAGVCTVDFSLSKYKKYDKFTVAIPLALAREKSSLTIKDGMMSMIINPKDLYTYEVSRKDFGDKDAYIRIHFERGKEDHIPRGKKASSKYYDIYFDYQYGKDTLDIDSLLKSGKLFMTYDKVAYPNRKSPYMAKFDNSKGQYMWLNKGTSGNIKESGRYILLSNR